MSVGFIIKDCVNVSIRNGVVEGYDVAVEAENVHGLDMDGLEVRAPTNSARRRSGFLSRAANLAQLGSFFEDVL